MIKAIDFFCGAGGLTHGLIESGIEVMIGIDSDEGVQKTYETNNPSARFKCFDIRELSPKDVNKEIGEIPKNHLMFAACAPCQPFSKQRTIPKDRSQRTLLGDFTKLIAAMKPEYVFVENVPGIAKISGNSTYHRFVSFLKKSGYFYDAADVDAKNYGVPQTRTRHILLACRSKMIRIPEPTNGPGRIPYKTVRETIFHFPSIKAGETHDTVPNHRASLLSPLNLRRLRLTVSDGGSRKDWPHDLILECHKENSSSSYTDVYGRMWWDRPAPALTCKCHSLSNGRYGHPEQNRAISLREAAALQSFPDDYIFFGNSKAQIGNQIGNAVPVTLAKIIGEQFLKNCASYEK